MIFSYSKAHFLQLLLKHRYLLDFRHGIVLAQLRNDIVHDPLANLGMVWTSCRMKRDCLLYLNHAVETLCLKLGP